MEWTEANNNQNFEPLNFDFPHSMSSACGSSVLMVTCSTPMIGYSEWLDSQPFHIHKSLWSFRNSNECINPKNNVELVCILVFRLTYQLLQWQFVQCHAHIGPFWTDSPKISQSTLDSYAPYCCICAVCSRLRAKRMQNAETANIGTHIHWSVTCVYHPISSKNLCNTLEMSKKWGFLVNGKRK